VTKVRTLLEGIISDSLHTTIAIQAFVVIDTVAHYKNERKDYLELLLNFFSNALPSYLLLETLMLTG
jgi:hypothetical protein